jgi:hypothetical protein
VENVEQSSWTVSQAYSASYLCAVSSASAIERRLLWSLYRGLRPPLFVHIFRASTLMKYRCPSLDARKSASSWFFVCSFRSRISVNPASDNSAGASSSPILPTVCAFCGLRLNTSAVYQGNVRAVASKPLCYLSAASSLIARPQPTLTAKCLRRQLTVCRRATVVPALRSRVTAL